MTRPEFRPPDTDLTVWDPIPLDHESPDLSSSPFVMAEDSPRPVFEFASTADLPVSSLLSVDQTDIGL